MSSCAQHRSQCGARARDGATCRWSGVTEPRSPHSKRRSPRARDPPAVERAPRTCCARRSRVRSERRWGRRVARLASSGWKCTTIFVLPARISSSPATAIASSLSPFASRVVLHGVSLQSRSMSAIGVDVKRRRAIGAGRRQRAPADQLQRPAHPIRDEDERPGTSASRAYSAAGCAGST